MPVNALAFAENQLGKRVPIQVLGGTTKRVAAVVIPYKVVMLGISFIGSVDNLPVNTPRSVPAKMEVVFQNQTKDGSINIKLHLT